MKEETVLEDIVNQESEPFAVNSIEVEDNSPLPDFVASLTQSEQLTADVANDFFKNVAPEKPSDSIFQDNFKTKVFGGNITPEEIRDEYKGTLKTLRQSYSRQVLMNIMSHARDGLDEASKKVISKKSSFAKLCDLIHNDYMTAAHVN